MRFASFDHFGTSLWKIVLVGAGASAVCATATSVIMGDVLGDAKSVVLLIIFLLVLYIVLSTPRRILDGQRVSQARESVLLSAAATACLSVTGSRPRTILLLKSRDDILSDSLRDTGRRVLLGTPVENALVTASRKLISYSVISAIRRIAKHSPMTFDAGDEETRGLSDSADLSNETKLPIFTTACFFTPIMLLFYAVFSHSYGFGSLVGLVAFQFVVLDLAFYLCSTERRAR